MLLRYRASTANALRALSTDTFSTTMKTTCRSSCRLQQLPLARAGAPEALFASLYLELHRLLDLQLRRPGPQMSLGTTTLLHEAYLDLARREGLRFPDESRFLSFAARAIADDAEVPEAGQAAHRGTLQRSSGGGLRWAHLHLGERRRAPHLRSHKRRQGVLLGV